MGSVIYLALGKFSLLRILSFVSPNQESISPHYFLCLDVVCYALLVGSRPRAINKHLSRCLGAGWKTWRRKPAKQRDRSAQAGEHITHTSKPLNPPLSHPQSPPERSQVTDPAQGTRPRAAEAARAGSGDRAESLSAPGKQQPPEPQAWPFLQPPGGMIQQKPGSLRALLQPELRGFSWLAGCLVQPG